MSSRRIISLSLGLLLGCGITLLAAPTKEEQEVAKYAGTLKSGSAKDKINALKELGKLGSISASLTKPVTSDIMKALDDKDAKVRAEAAHTIGKIDVENKKEVVDKLTKMLTDEKDDAVKHGAAMGLGAIGPDASSAVGALRDAQAKAAKGDQTYQLALQSITGKKKKN